MAIKNFFFLVFMSLFVHYNAQTYVKVNGFTLPALMLNAGIETKLTDKTTFQADVFVSPWKSLFGNKMLFAIGSLEYRYYFTESFKNWYVAANTGVAIYRMQKYNYLNLGIHQEGYSILLGGTVGYVVKVNDKINLDIFLGGGNAQSKYRSYFNAFPDIRADKEEGASINGSGEWIPYKGGVMISYQLK